MTAEENVSYVESTMGLKEAYHIRRSTYLGRMRFHHLAGVDPANFPKRQTELKTI